MKKNFFTACVMAAFTLPVSFPVLADGFYVAGDVGQAKWNATSGSETDIAFSIAGGYKIDAPFNDTCAIELGYRDLGGFKESDNSGIYSADLNATQLSVLSSHSINDLVSLYGRLGIADLQMDTKVDNGENSSSSSMSKSKVVYGIGGHYAVNQQLGAYVEYDRYGKWRGIIISMLMVGVDYQF